MKIMADIRSGYITRIKDKPDVASVLFIGGIKSGERTQTAHKSDRETQTHFLRPERESF
jgi:hypothetical protein